MGAVLDDLTLKNKVLRILYAQFLTHKYKEPKSRGRSGIAGRKNSYLAKTLSVPVTEIDRISVELQSDALIDVAPFDNDQMLSLTGWAIKKFDFEEKLVQVKSPMFIEMVAGIIDTNLKEVKSSDEQAWKSKLLSLAKSLAEKTYEIAIQAAIDKVLK